MTGGIEVCDTTLRDGEQMPGVVFSLKEKRELARASSEFGSSIIEVMPAISKTEQRLAKSLAHENLAAKITASTLSKKEHIELATNCDLDHITLFTSLSDNHLKHKLNISREENLSKSLEMVDFAKSQGLAVAFAGEDSTRANKEYLHKFVKAMAGKIDYFLPCDTVGCLQPFQTYRFIKQLVKNTGSKIALHTHNDFGMATANTIAGIMAGAEVFSGTFNGIGERSGNAAIEEVCMALKVLLKKDLGLKYEMLTRICNRVEKYSRAKMHKHKPIVGKNSFRHESGTHVAGVLKDPSTYEIFDPAEVGQTRKIVFGKHSGMRAVKKILKGSKGRLNRKLQLLKRTAEREKKSFSERKARKLMLGSLQ